MDPISFLLDDPLYHLTHDVYEFEPLEFPNPEPNKDAADQILHNNTHCNISLRDEGPIIGGDEAEELEGETMNGEAAGRINGNRKRKRKEKSKEKGKMEMHREVERQRRQDMASLHRSLRTLLPAEYLKGKRSMSDHLHEAAEYIRYLKVKNQVLREKRDKLEAGTELADPSSVSDLDDHRDRLEEKTDECAVDKVVVKGRRDGVEVLVGVKGSVGNGMGVSTSRVLKALLHQGLDVTSCVSTHSNNKWIHCVQAQVGQGSNIYTKLQQKLTKNLSA